MCSLLEVTDPPQIRNLRPDHAGPWQVHPERPGAVHHLGREGTGKKINNKKAATQTSTWGRIMLGQKGCR